MCSSGNNLKESWPKIKFTGKMEILLYEMQNQYLEMDFYFGKFPHVLHVEGMNRWLNKEGQNEENLTDIEKKDVFNKVIVFLSENKIDPIKPKIVINKSDPSRELWETLCREYSNNISGIEYET